MMVFVGGNPENGLFFKVVKKKFTKQIYKISSLLTGSTVHSKHNKNT